jgi:hypothetical protein
MLEVADRRRGLVGVWVTGIFRGRILPRKAGTRTVNAPWGAHDAFKMKLLVRGDGLRLCIPDSVEEYVCGRRRGYLALKNAARGNVMPVDGLG